MIEFECLWCEDGFTSTDAFISHLKCEHKYMNKICPICHQPYRQFYRLKNHMKKYIENNPKLRKIEENKQQNLPQVASTSSADVMERNLPTEDLNSLLQKCVHNLTVQLSKKFNQEDVQFILDLLKEKLLQPMFGYLKDMFQNVEESQLNDRIMQILQLDLDKIFPTPPTD